VRQQLISITCGPPSVRPSAGLSLFGPGSVVYSRAGRQPSINGDESIDYDSFRSKRGLQDAFST
jgi:hypothetical protein